MGSIYAHKHANLEPSIDVFASKRNAVLNRFFASYEDAFQQDWGHDLLWLCPPFSKLVGVIVKIFADKAEGIILIPVWKYQQWSEKLG